MRQSGALLVEVGTTNRTRLSDYETAITERTALLVKVHRSNFAMVGFTEETSVADLAILGRRRQVPVFHDLGSGNLVPLQSAELREELTVRTSIQAGADIVAFSGDKLLGGPQAGVIVGKKSVLERLKKHPLNRALRIDKLTVAALEATLQLYRDGREDEAIPTRAALLAKPEVLLKRAQRLASLLGSLPHRLVESQGRVGGGSMPLAAPKSWAVALPGVAAVEVHEKLRAGAPPVVARIVDDEVWLDVRCLEDAELEVVARAIANAVREKTGD
jgi:L-seryl-tRNA(Ser) seleniumtransferase